MVNNVYLLTHSEQESPKVNFLIQDYKLVLVSPDPIPIEEEAKVIDAQGGYAMGQFKLGEPLTTLVFTENPKEKNYLLLDTKHYAKLSFYNGVLTETDYQEQKGSEHLEAIEQQRRQERAQKAKDEQGKKRTG